MIVCDICDSEVKGEFVHFGLPEKTPKKRVDGTTDLQSVHLCIDCAVTVREWIEKK